MAERLGPPPKKADERFDNWVFRLWKRAFGALNSGDVGVTAPIVVTTSGTGTLNIGHGTSGVTSGTYGSASVIPQVVVDTYGHVTSVGTNAVAIAGTSVTGTDLTVNTPLLGTVTNALLRAGAISHATSGVIPGTFGASGTVGQFVVNTYGHVTSAAGVQIDHGSIGGLSDDDHPQYGLIASAESITGAWDFRNSGGLFHRFNGTSSYQSGLIGQGTHAGFIWRMDGVRHFGIRWNGTLAEFMDASANSVNPSAWTGSRFTMDVLNTSGTFAGNLAATGTLTGGVLAGTLAGTYVGGQDLTVSSPLTGTAANALLRAGTIGHGTSGVVTGTYGGALGLARVIVDTYGHITAGTSFPLQATAPITVGSNAGTFTWGHSTSGIVPGTFGAATIIPQVVVNTYGHVTAVNTFALTGTAVAGADVSVTSPITISGTSTNAVLRPFTIAHATSGIVPGTFGGASTIPQIVVNTYGHVTAVNELAVTASAEHSRLLTAHTTMGTYASRVYASELILGTYDLNIPSTSFVVTVG